MAVEQDFLPFGIGVGANVIDQSDYAAAQSAGFVAVGFAAGLAQSAQLNKVWRQSSVIGYIIGQFISDLLIDQNVLDNGDTATLLSQFKSAVLAQAGGSSTPLIVTSSAPLVLDLTDTYVAFNRSAGVAAMPVQLPDLPIGQSCKIQDVRGNFSTAKVTVSPPGGTISNLANFVMNEDLQTCVFTRLTNVLWGVET